MTIAAETLIEYTATDFLENEHLADAVVKDVEKYENEGLTEELAIHRVMQEYLISGATGRLAFAAILLTTIGDSE